MDGEPDDTSIAEDGAPTGINNNAVSPDAAERAEAWAEVQALDQGAVQANANEQAVLGVAGDGVAGYDAIDESGVLVQERFLEFLGSFKQDVPCEGDDQEDQVVYPYATQAASMAQRQLARRSINPENAEAVISNASPFSNTLLVEFNHILEYDVELAEAIQSDYIRFEPYIRNAIQSFIFELHPELEELISNNHHHSAPPFFCAFYNLPSVQTLRNLRTGAIGRLTSVSGTVTRTSEVRPELLTASFRCSACGLVAQGIRQEFHYTRPVTCRNPRCGNQSPNKFILETAMSEFVDWQSLRVQESASELPAGSMPRSMTVVVRHEMVERAKAGDGCVFTGSLVVIPDGSALSRAGEAPRATFGGGNKGSDTGGGVRGLPGLGVRELTYRTCFVATSVLSVEAAARLAASSANVGTPGAAASTTAAMMVSPSSNASSWDSSHEATAEQVVMEMSASERNEIRQMKSSPRLYEQMVESICANTYGHKEVKKGILLMLLGGVHKTTMDGIKLRGDVNVCIVGDPSTAKSQFLKYVHAFLPARCVYTSGKASSAAGLTAAVQRDSETGDYGIEAGALMLADNGICCIDEFDKMDPNDQVAIHEAMEQQTISITKAGIQATLNARASILAAANPIYGRYDRTKTLQANVALSSPILSRFDLFFVILDECNVDADRHVAQHILKVHRCQEDAVRPPFTKEQMQRYIRFARTIHPKITPESQRVLVDCYRRLRQGDTLGRSRSAYRITVRQLESMIRLSEGLARLHCDSEIQPAYVREAFRLLKTSIIQLETSEVEMGEDELNGDLNDGDDQDGDANNGTSAANQETAESDAEDQDEPETQTHFPGEYGSEDAPVPPTEMPEPPIETKPKKKTKISYSEYEAIANAIATHLRSLETEDFDAEGEASTGKHLKWGEIVTWFLEEIEQEIGDSVERLDEMRKKVNLVIRRLVNVDLVLVTIGEQPRNKREEQQTQLMVHPNYVIS